MKDICFVLFVLDKTETQTQLLSRLILGAQEWSECFLGVFSCYCCIAGEQAKGKLLFFSE